jgi:hypothetical protein
VPALQPAGNVTTCVKPDGSRFTCMAPEACGVTNDGIHQCVKVETVSGAIASRCLPARWRFFESRIRPAFPADNALFMSWGGGCQP